MGNLKKPNLLIIVADQLRYDCLGSSGMNPVKTPNLNQLATEGMRFSHAYTPIPVCSPARQAFLNGRRPESFGALWNHGFLPVKSLEPNDFIWSNELKGAGYRTGFIGKWGIHPQLDPTSFGFDEYISDKEYHQMRKEKYPDVNLFSNQFFGTVDPADLEDSHTHWTANKVNELIGKFSKQEQPWHIRLDFSEPHPPCCPAEPFASMNKPEDVPEWGSFRDEFKNKPWIQKQQLVNWQIEAFTWEDWAPIVSRYFAMIQQLDDAIGRVLTTLDQLGIADETIVIFTADHGDMCGGHKMIDKHYVMYDDVVRVPLIVKWPGLVVEGSECNEFICNFLDLPPTILEALSLPVPKSFQGQSLLPFLRGEKSSNWRKAVVSTYNGQQFGLYSQRMIRTKQWKYIWNLTDIDELYDVENDPYELVNRINDKQAEDIVIKLRRHLFDELNRTGDRLVTENAWMRSQLLAEPLEQSF